jgi:phage FluMu protein Com
VSAATIGPFGTAWRCKHCNALLAIADGDRLHIRFARGHQYIVGLPASVICRWCRTLNEVHREAPRPNKRP